MSKNCLWGFGNYTHGAVQNRTRDCVVGKRAFRNELCRVNDYERIFQNKWKSQINSREGECNTRQFERDLLNKKKSKIKKWKRQNIRPICKKIS